MPTGLSRTSQPCTSRFSRLPLPCGCACRTSAVIASLVLPFQIAPHCRRSQQPLDPFRFIEALVDPESDFGSEFQIDVTRDLAAQEALVTIERSQHRFAV